MAPVAGSGSCPAWMARVSNPGVKPEVFLGMLRKYTNLRPCYNSGMRGFRATAILMVILSTLAALPLAARASKDYTEIKLIVIDAERGQPVPKAAITLTFVRGKNVFGKKDRALWDVK